MRCCSGIGPIIGIALATGRHLGGCVNNGHAPRWLGLAQAYPASFFAFRSRR